MLYRIVGLVLVLSALLGAWSYHRGMSLPQLVASEMAPAGKQAVTPHKISLPDANPTNLPINPPAPPPAPSPTPSQSWPQVRVLISKSDAEVGLLSANGQLLTQPHTRMSDRGVNLSMKLTDSSLMSLAQLENMAEGMANPRAVNPWSCDLVVLSSADVSGFLSELNANLKAHGSDCRAVVVAALGRSRSRLRLMGIAPVQALVGNGLAATSEAIHSPEVQSWLAASRLEMNLNTGFFDRQKVNWVAAANDAEAARSYGKEETSTRLSAEVVAGGPSNAHLRPAAVITSLSFYDLPTQAHRAGLSPLVEFGPGPEQPCVIIGIDKWLSAHHPLVEALVAAALQGNRDVLRSSATREAATGVLTGIFAASHAAPQYTEALAGPATLYAHPSPQDSFAALGTNMHNGAAPVDVSFLPRRHRRHGRSPSLFR